MTTKLLTASAITLLLTACGSAQETMMDDSDDGSSVQDMIEVQDIKVKMNDDGTVKGATTEDAGGDGTNTTGGSAMMDDHRTVTITASDWEFAPNVITAKQGEKVTVVVEGAAGDHGLAIPDLGINVTIDEGGTASFELPTDTAGTFGGSCSVPCGKGHRDMQISVIIE